MRQLSQKFTFLFPAVFWLMFFFVIPLTIIFVYSFFERGIYGGIEYVFSFNNYYRVIDPLYLKAVLRTVYIASLNTLICLIIGYPLAYFISNQSQRKKNILLFLVTLPFWTNFLVRIYAWMIILRTEGFLNNVLLWMNLINKPFEILFTDKAVLIGMVYGYLPFMILPLYASIEKLDRNYLDAARDLGATPIKTFWRVIIPLTKPGIIAGSILVFVPSLGAFIIPDLLGGAKSMMIGNLIKDQFLSARDWPFGSALSFIVMAVVLILLMIYLRFGQTVSEKLYSNK
ncbi:MAG: ABC transporter permease [Planctomycetota bacterium]